VPLKSPRKGPKARRNFGSLHLEKYRPSDGFTRRQPLATGLTAGPIAGQLLTLWRGSIFHGEQQLKWVRRVQPSREAARPPQSNFYHASRCQGLDPPSLEHCPCDLHASNRLHCGGPVRVAGSSLNLAQRRSAPRRMPLRVTFGSCQPGRNKYARNDCRDLGGQVRWYSIAHLGVLRGPVAQEDVAVRERL